MGAFRLNSKAKYGKVDLFNHTSVILLSVNLLKVKWGNLFWHQFYSLIDRKKNKRLGQGIQNKILWRNLLFSLILFHVRAKWESPFKNYKSSPIKNLLLCAVFSTGKIVIVLQPIEKFNRKRFFQFLTCVDFRQSFWKNIAWFYYSAKVGDSLCQVDNYVCHRLLFFYSKHDIFQYK